MASTNPGEGEAGVFSVIFIYIGLTNFRGFRILNCNIFVGFSEDSCFCFVFVFLGWGWYKDFMDIVSSSQKLDYFGRSFVSI